jgi:hypothetical protein
VPLVAVGAILLSTGIEILPADPIFWKLTLGRLLVIVALVALVVGGARLRDFRTALDIPIALLLFAAIVTTLRHPIAGEDEAAPLRFLVTVIAFFYVTVAMCRRQPAVRLALPMIATFAIVASAVVGVEQVAQDQFTGFYRDGFTPVVSGQPQPELLPRARGSFSNPNLLAAHVLLLAPLAVAFALSAVAREVRVVLMCLAGLAYLGLVLTFSRAGVGAAILAGLVVAYALRAEWRQRIQVVAAIGVAFLLLGAAVTGGDLVGDFGRTEAMSLSVDVATDNPTTGVGLGRSGDAMTAIGDRGDEYRHAHNLWLTWLTEAGPLALIAWVWIAAWLLWRGYRAAGRGRVLAASSLAAVTAFFIFSMTDHPSNGERIATAFWFIAALIAAGARPGKSRLLEYFGASGRRAGTLGATALALVALAGCGGDDEPVANDPRTSQSPELSTGTDRQPTDGTVSEEQPADPTATMPEETEGTPGETAPPRPPSEDDVPGGPGDEEPIGVDAAFTGRAGRVTPRVVRVPPFVQITVTLKSADGDDYAIEIKGKRVVVGSGTKRASVKLDGLRQGRSYRGRVRGGGSVRIDASAEPGP